MLRKGNLFQLDDNDVESAVRQFVCSCHPDVATGHTVEVWGHKSCVAAAIRPQEDKVSAATSAATRMDKITLRDKIFMCIADGFSDNKTPMFIANDIMEKIA